MSNPKDVDVVKVARFMFDRNAVEYGATQETLDEFWDQEGVKKFWTDEAASVLSFIGFAGPE